MRVLLVNDLPPGPGSGAEVHLGRLADGLLAAGHDVELFAGRIVHRGMRKALDLWDPFARRDLTLQVGEFGADVVHFHNVLRELSPAVFDINCDVVKVMTVHDLRVLGVPDGLGTPGEQTRDPLRALKRVSAYLARALTRRRMHAVIAPSRHIERGLRAAGFADVHWIPSFGPPPGEPTAAPSRSRDVLYAGRLAMEKGVLLLVEAFAQIADRHPEARLIIAGDGPERGRLEARAAALGDRRVRLLGVLREKELQRLMGSVRVVAAPSLTREAAPLVAVEAALAGRPLIVADDPGLRDVVDEAGCGLVVPRGDHVALAAALSELLADPPRADALGEAGRRAALALRTTEVAVAATVDVYQRARERVS